MDIMEATSLSEILLDRAHIEIETVPLSGEEMIDDLRTRGETQGWPWRFALIIGRIRDHGAVSGMIILEPVGDSYKGIFYPQANCGGGDRDVASKLTAKMVSLLDEWPDDEALARTVIWFDGLRVSNLHEEDEFGRLIHEGPSIEPI